MNDFAFNPRLTLCGISASSPSFAFLVNSFTPGSESKNFGRTVVANDNSSWQADRTTFSGMSLVISGWVESTMTEANHMTVSLYWLLVLSDVR